MITVSMAGFEPAFSSTPSWRIARLSYTLNWETVQVTGAIFPLPLMKERRGLDSNQLLSGFNRCFAVCKLLPLGTVTQSVQRESNPHIYHGKVAGGRYIMDAFGPMQVAAAMSYRC